jgi:hypothetical protein
MRLRVPTVWWLSAALAAGWAVAFAPPARAWSDQEHKYTVDPRGYHNERWARDHSGGLLYPPLIIGAVPPPPVPARTGSWYRCDSPAGYYPYISACRTPWRTVSARPVH